MITPLPNHRIVGHHGGVPGFAADNEVVLDAGVAVVALGDATTFRTGSFENAALAALFPDLARLIAESRAAEATKAAALAASPESAAALAQFRTALAGLLAGTVDRSAYAAALRARMTDAVVAAAAAQLAPLGALGATTLLSSSADHGMRTSTIRAAFARQAATWRFTLDPDGKIAEMITVG
jgi:hypothetical protein